MRALIAPACTILLAGCGTGAPTAPEAPPLRRAGDLGLEPETILPLPGGSGMVAVRGRALSRPLVTAEVRVGQGGTLSFWATGDEACGGRCVVETWISEEGGEKLVDATTVAARRGSPIDALGRRVAIDLSPWAGKRIAIRWSLRPGTGGGLAAVAALRVTAAPLPPDVLMVCSDAHRYDRAFGDRGAELMPELSALARESSVYERAYAAGSWTLPSIASTLTGLHPRFHGTGFRTARDRDAAFDPSTIPGGQFGIRWSGRFHVFTAYPASLSTLSERLAEHGYVSALVVTNAFYMTSGLLWDGADVMFHLGAIPGAEVNDVAGSVMEALGDGGAPVLMLVHYIDVHNFRQWGFERSHPGADMFDAPREQVLASYDAAVTRTDTNLGELLGSWNRRSRAAGSAIVFFADHGEHLRDEGHPTRDPSAGDEEWARARLELPILNHGNSMDDALLHVPLLVRFPGGVAGSVSRQVSLVDLVPTLVELAGGSTPDLPGRPLRADGPERTFFADYQLYGPELSSVRRGEGKLVMDLDAHRLVGTEGLRPELESYLAAASRATAGLRSTTVNDPEQVLRELRGLGYVQ